jgi:hypothetical protein
MPEFNPEVRGVGDRRSTHHQSHPVKQFGWGLLRLSLNPLYISRAHGVSRFKRRPCGVLPHLLRIRNRKHYLFFAQLMYSRQNA